MAGILRRNQTLNGEGVKASISRRHSIGFVVAAIVLAANALISHRTIAELMRAQVSGDESLQVTGVLRDLRSDAAEVESARRSYILSGAPDGLVQAVGTLSRSQQSTQRLRALKESGAGEIDKIDRLDSLLRSEAESLGVLIEVHHEHGRSAVIKSIRASASAERFEQIHGLIASLVANEAETMKQRAEASKGRAALNIVTAWVANGFNLALLALLLYLAHREIRERRQSEFLLKFNATHDSLTDLPNRLALTERVSLALAQAPARSSKVAVLFIDLDRFKNINDTLGHEVGDLVLREVAARLVKCIRKSDFIARQGGDEFVVLVESISDQADLTRVAKGILVEVARPILLCDREFHVTASIGISVFPDHGGNLQALLKNADIAMYRAKDKGKNTYHVYSSQEDRHSIKRLDMESALRRAVESGNLEMYFQPKVDASSRVVVGVEGLLRWQHPESGLILPSKIVPLVEELGLTRQLGIWAMRTACAQHARWLRQGLPPMRVAVNLCARQLVDADFAADVRAVLGEAGLDPRWLELEITESMMMQEPRKAQAVLRELKDMGVCLSVDDFGTGYSSMNYVKQLPIDCLKIDRSFIGGVPKDESDAAITKTIISMAHSLKLRVVAEGVETKQQLEFLIAQECDEFQGYYFAKPMPADRLVNYIAEQRAAASRGQVLQLPARTHLEGAEEQERKLPAQLWKAGPE